MPFAPHVIRQLFAVQLLVVGVASLLSFVLDGWIGAYSAALGGTIYMLPHAYFAWRAFAHRGAQEIRRIVSAFYLAEVVKIVISIGLFIVVFRFVSLSIVPFFLTYILTQSVLWFYPWLGKK